MVVIYWKHIHIFLWFELLFLHVGYKEDVQFSSRTHSEVDGGMTICSQYWANAHSRKWAFLTSVRTFLSFCLCNIMFEMFQYPPRWNLLLVLLPIILTPFIFAGVHMEEAQPKALSQKQPVYLFNITTEQQWTTQELCSWFMKLLFFGS